LQSNANAQSNEKKGKNRKMRVVIIWREDTEYARSVIEWLRDCERRIGLTPESLSPDEPDGESLCRTYDVVEYPTILAMNDDGNVLQAWRGRDLPRIDDVSYYLIEH